MLGLCLPPESMFGCMLQDEASYIAGERAALLRAFRETLPSQQALGSLFHAVQHLTKRMDQEGNDVHQVSTAVTCSVNSLMWFVRSTYLALHAVVTTWIATLQSQTVCAGCAQAYLRSHLSWIHCVLTPSVHFFYRFRSPFRPCQQLCRLPRGDWMP